MNEKEEGIRVSHVSKMFNGQPVLSDVSFFFEKGSVNCLMGASGSGKTTLFRILMSLEEAETGSVTGVKRVSAVFQEDRLLEDYNAVENVCIVLPGHAKRQQTAGKLQRLLPGDCIYQPVRELSGGMRRRVALARAMFAASELLILDEPFTGLDSVSKELAFQFIRDFRAGRTLLFSTHDRMDAEALGATICLLTRA